MQRYLSQAVSAIPNSIIRARSMDIKCNVCGDSKKNPNLKRGHLILSRSPGSSDEFWVYKCFNEGDCDAAGQGNAWSGKKWLKQYFPHLYTLYNKEVFKGDAPSKTRIKPSVSKHSSNKKSDVEVVEKKVVEEIKPVEKVADDSKHIVDFIPIKIGKGKIFEQAKQYCINRKIPESIWSKFFVCTGKCLYQNRLIIPFFDNKNNIYYFQGRALSDKQQIKYINRKVNKNNSIYNLYNIDKEKPVVVLEGPIDSMFIENAVATIGLGISADMTKTMEQFKTYFIFDNDKPGRSMAKKYLAKKQKVFMWKKFIKDYRLPKSIKDINDVFILLNRTKAFTFSALEEYFTDSKYSLIHI